MADFDHLDFFRKMLEAQLRRLKKGRLVIRLPRPLEGGVRRVAGTHVHFCPELFIQAGGFTDFSFPREKTRLMAGEILLVPRGLPHGEVARDYGDRFLNMVVAFPPDGVCMHAAREGAGGKPQMFALEHFKTDSASRIEQYLDDIVYFHGSGQDDETAGETVRGLFQAILAALLMLVRRFKSPGRINEHPKISECRKYILGNIYDSSLNVKKLAGHIHCAPDYLSHLFVKETGERLTEFIRQERMALARRHLRNPALSVKEIAWSCGFADQGYFCRLFKRLTCETPVSYRQKCRAPVFRGSNA